jgi:hypothetical protein
MKTYEVYLTITREITKVYEVEANQEDEAILAARVLCKNDEPPQEETLEYEDIMCFQTIEVNP